MRGHWAYLLLFFPLRFLFPITSRRLVYISLGLAGCNSSADAPEEIIERREELSAP